MKRPLFVALLVISVSGVVASAGSNCYSDHGHGSAHDHGHKKDYGHGKDPGKGHDHDHGDGHHGPGNAFVNDPCLDPPPPLLERTVQSETEIAVLNSAFGDDRDRDFNWWIAFLWRLLHEPGLWRSAGDRDDDDSGRLMVAGYNDSWGFYDENQGLSGFSYSTTGGAEWIDGGGLPPAGTGDALLGQPSVAVHHRTRTFYYASIYQTSEQLISVSVSRGEFKVARQRESVKESFANTRCEHHPELYGVRDEPEEIRERILWDDPVAAVEPTLGVYDKPSLYVNQETGVLYLTYTRFFEVEVGVTIEMVRSFDGGQTWTPPSVIVPNLIDTLNHGVKAVVTPGGRVVATWAAHTFPFLGAPEEERIESAFSDTCRLATDPCTFSTRRIVARPDPQGAPIGDNSGELTVDNLPSIAVDKGRDDGRITQSERNKPGFGTVYITYFDGRTPFASPLCDPPDPEAPDPDTPVCVPYARAANILLSRSTDGKTFAAPVKVNDDRGDTSHVFPSVQVNQFGEVFVTWIDRRRDPKRNLLSDTWGDISLDRGRSFDRDGRLSTVSSDWIVRADPEIRNFGTHNSSAVVGFTHFISIWADGRFPRPAPITATEPPFVRSPDDMATPDVFTAIVRRSSSSSGGHHDK